MHNFCHRIDFLLLRLGGNVNVIVFICIGKAITNFVNSLSQVTVYEKRIHKMSKDYLKNLWLAIYTFTGVSLFLLVLDLIYYFIPSINCRTPLGSEFADSLLWLITRFVNFNIWVWVMVYVMLMSVKKQMPTSPSSKGSKNSQMGTPLNSYNNFLVKCEPEAIQRERDDSIISQHILSAY